VYQNKTSRIGSGVSVEDQRVGTVVASKYRLDAFLSRGGMGAVYRATHLMLGKACVLKVIRPDLVSSPDVVRRFLREARAAAALSHPNIVIVFDLGEAEDGTLYIAMEFVQGRSLHEVIKQDGPMQPSRIVHLLRGVASALALAHREHIVHRDLKPHNLMIARDAGGRETVKLLDFGIAKTFDGTTELTATGLMLGTPQYMAPEQVMDGAIDHRTDLYAIGVILYQMLVGEVPFNATSAAALMMKHVNDPPDPPSRRRPELRIPAALEAVALRCLEKDPARRFQSADELAAALERVPPDQSSEPAPVPLSDASTIVLGTPTPPAVAPTPPAVPPDAPQSPRKSAWRIAGAAFAAVWILAFAVWVLGVFRGGAPAGGDKPAAAGAGKSAAAGTDPIAPAGAGPDAAAAPAPAGTGDTTAPVAANAQPAQPGAFIGPPPAVPTVSIHCAGSQDVCGPLTLAFELTIESERLPAAARADTAEIAVAIRAMTSQDREQKPGGLMWEQTYSVVVECRVPRFGSVIAMPPPRTLVFDSHFGRDAAMEAGRAMARDAVARIKEFWKTHASR
jgi:serine/threonine protein kinase